MMVFEFFGSSFLWFFIVLRSTQTVIFAVGINDILIGLVFVNDFVAAYFEIEFFYFLMCTTDEDIEIVSVNESPLFELNSQLSLFNELEKYSNQLPRTRKAFLTFVKTKITTVNYNEKVVNLVWDKIHAKNLERAEALSNEPPIVLSSDDESTNSAPIVLNVQTVQGPEVKSEERKISLKKIEQLVDPSNVQTETKKRKRKLERNESSNKATPLKCDVNNRSSKPLSKNEAEKLRMDLFLDKVLEVTLPAKSNTKPKKKKKKLNSTV